MEERTFRISGHVVDQHNQGIEGLRIEAWDKDLIYNDLVGNATTLDEGAFEISCRESSFREHFGDRKPDLFFNTTWKVIARNA
jgi:hypothetical protein